MSGEVTILHVINGERIGSQDGATFASVNPASRAPWATVARGSAQDVDLAVQAARVAFDDGPWPRLPSTERAVLLHRVADLIDAHADELARLDTLDMGKPLTQARTQDVPRAVHNFRFFADYAKFVVDQAFATDTPHHAYTRREPVGVAAAISPWNFPLMLATWKIAPALAFGNTVVLKPAEQAPASCTRLAELALEAGLPPGVLNVVHGFGPGEAGEALTRHPGVDLVTFTGESATGRAIMGAAAPTLKRLSFELGGKAANVIFGDADLDEAVNVAARAGFTNAGQICLAGARLYVERDAYEDFLARLIDRAEALRLGDPLDAATDIGPLASPEQHQKVLGYLTSAERDGAKLNGGGADEGWWVRPTVVTNVRSAMRVCRDEIFGPVVTVQPFETEDEALALANDTPYGLNAMVFTESLRRAHRFAAGLRAGTVWVNCFNVRDLRLPFGGYKDSGIGREGGEHSREFFTEGKAVVVAT
jgi:aminomuconate-semialdehyde/2-hydroxymuconate-6-semialdehyde dehydrogenase